MSKLLIKYNSVFDRTTPEMITFQDFLDYKGNDEIQSRIREEKDKEVRNEMKRTELEAVDFGLTDLIVIDVDGVNEDLRMRQEIINKLSKVPYIHVIKETSSGNLALFVRYDRTLLKIVKFYQIYYKLWLELTLNQEINIDFLPEQNRLRYLSNGEVFFHNPSSTIYTNKINIKNLPYINTNFKPTTGENTIFGSSTTKRK